MGFCITIQFGDLIKAVGEEGAYWLFGSLCLLGGFYVFFFVPETQNLSLDEIQLYFVKRSKSTTNITTDTIQTLWGGIHSNRNGSPSENKYSESSL